MLLPAVPKSGSILLALAIPMCMCDLFLATVLCALCGAEWEQRGRERRPFKLWGGNVQETVNLSD